MELSPQERFELEEETRLRIRELAEAFRHEIDQYQNVATKARSFGRIMIHLEDIRMLAKLLEYERLNAYAELFYDVIDVYVNHGGAGFALISDWFRVLSLQLYDLQAQVDNDPETLAQLDFTISQKPDLAYPEKQSVDALKHLTILFVEDEQEPREAAVTYLRRRVHDIYEAADGEEGLELYRRHKPDIIITDLEMPKKGGIDMLKEIRKENPFVPVVITTAYGDRPYYMEANRLVIHTYLVKPFALKDLEQELLKLSSLI